MPVGSKDGRGEIGGGGWLQALNGCVTRFPPTARVSSQRGCLGRRDDEQGLRSGLHSNYRRGRHRVSESPIQVLHQYRNWNQGSGRRMRGCQRVVGSATRPDPQRWERQDEGMEDERQRVAGPRLQWRGYRRWAMDRVYGGSGEDGFVAAEASRLASLERVQSDRRKTRGTSSGGQ